MKAAFKMLGVAVGILVILAAGIATYIRATGLSALDQPSSVETAVARTMRGLAVGPSIRSLKNPVTRAPEALAAGRTHFADHCAACHGNDGSGNVDMGRNLFPKAPDMRAPATQNLTDGELFWIIERGIRFTGMPGWSTGTSEGEEASWQVVHFIRHLPDLTEAELQEMEALNPRSPAEVRQDIEAERFLRGEDVR